MAGKGVRSLAEAMRSLSLAPATPKVAVLQRPILPSLSRSMATEAAEQLSVTGRAPFIHVPSRMPLWLPHATVPVTINAYPSLEPVSLEQYSVQHLAMPLRKDLLHLAVIYEGDKTRQGTAHVKNRYEVHGSHRKLYRQKGTGMARVGSKQSPIRRGGGKAHGPRHRDFSTDLNRKVYDQAWRIALSYRYRRGDLIVVQDGIELPLREDFAQAEKTLPGLLREGFWKKWVASVMNAQGLGKQFGRTLFVTEKKAPRLFKGLNEYGYQHGRALTLDDVDIKDLLEKGKVVIERECLREMLRQHQSDLVSKVAVNGWVNPGPEIGIKVKLNGKPRKTVKEETTAELREKVPEEAKGAIKENVKPE